MVLVGKQVATNFMVRGVGWGGGRGRKATSFPGLLPSIVDRVGGFRRSFAYTLRGNLSKCTVMFSQEFTKWPNRALPNPLVIDEETYRC